MRLFNYEVRKVPDFKEAILEKAETNAKSGLIQAQLELRHHELLLEQCGLRMSPELEPKAHDELEREIRLTEEAIERDKKSINNWETQLRAINYERNT